MIQGPRPEEIKKIFSSVAHGYDKANDAMTFGMAHSWRRKLVRWSGAQHGMKVLDCATGTGDLALEFKRAVGDQGLVIGTDFCEDMLKSAPNKAKAAGLNVRFQFADVLNLPFEANTFDVASIAYGIRNVENPIKALQEMARVVKPGGHVMILETGDSPDSRLKFFINFYVRKVVPRVGGWITGQRQAYEYLNRSSQSFPSRERFLALLNESGAFAAMEYKVLMGGASFIYKARVR